MMRIGLIVLAAAGSVMASPSTVFAQVQIGPPPQLQFPRPLAPLLRTCPDPAVVSFGLANITSRADGARRLYSFQLVATIRNVGNQRYTSGANQQLATIYRRPAGGNPVGIGSGNFATLNAGAQIVVRSATQTNWSKSDEFPPSFEARIAYDPDIRIDGNPNNDECSSGNNLLMLTGRQINAMLP